VELCVGEVGRQASANPLTVPTLAPHLGVVGIRGNAAQAVGQQLVQAQHRLSLGAHEGAARKQRDAWRKRLERLNRRRVRAEGSGEAEV
jgi:hypothetical protein